MARVPKVVHYRQLDIRNDPLNGRTLEQVLRLVLQNADVGGAVGTDWRERLYLVPPEDEDVYFFNHIRHARNYVFGDLVCYTPGRQQSMLEEIDAVPEIPIEQFEAPAGREFLNAMLFWLVTGDHVFLIQDSKLRGSDVEKYFQWLLSERTNVMPRNAEIVLLDTLDRRRLGEDVGEVKSLRLGGALQSHRPVAAEVEPRGDQVRRQAVALGRREGDQAWVRQVLALILGGERAVENVLGEVPEDAELSVDVLLGIATKRRREVDKTSLLDIARAVRNLPDADLRIEGKMGTLSGNEVRLKHPVSIEMDGSLPNRNDVLRALIEAYRIFVMNGKIDPTDLRAG